MTHPDSLFKTLSIIKNSLVSNVSSGDCEERDEWGADWQEKHTGGCLKVQKIADEGIDCNVKEVEILLLDKLPHQQMTQRPTCPSLTLPRNQTLLDEVTLCMVRWRQESGLRVIQLGWGLRGT